MLVLPFLPYIQVFYNTLAGGTITIGDTVEGFHDLVSIGHMTVVEVYTTMIRGYVTDGDWQIPGSAVNNLNDITSVATANVTGVGAQFPNYNTTIYDTNTNSTGYVVSVTNVGSTASQGYLTLSNVTGIFNNGDFFINNPDTPTFYVAVQNGTPLQVIGIVTAAGCLGQNNGTITTTVAGDFSPFTYMWSNGSTDANLTGLAAGLYWVVVTDDIGSTVMASFIVPASSNLNLDFTIQILLMLSMKMESLNL